MNLEQKIAKYEKLKSFFSENKANIFDRVIQNRTRYLTVMIENVFQPQNASAVLRTCDLMGVQDVHIIENYNKYKVNPHVALGASKWLNLYKYSEKPYNTLEAYEKLRQQGYRIIATTPHQKGVTLDELPLDTGKMALVFGTELEGLTDQAIEYADEYVSIPMYGFTESFNISVSAALIVRDLIERLHRSDIKWQLGDAEKMDIMIEWALKVINHRHKHLKDDFEDRVDRMPTER